MGVRHWTTDHGVVGSAPAYVWTPAFTHNAYLDDWLS